MRARTIPTPAEPGISHEAKVLFIEGGPVVHLLPTTPEIAEPLGSSELHGNEVTVVGRYYSTMNAIVPTAVLERK